MKFDGDDSSESESGFRKGLGASTRGGQTYCNRHPGRLASRLLLRMQDGVARGAWGPNENHREKTPAVALNYVLTILIPHLGQKVGLRSTRELKTLGAILDRLAEGSTW